MLNINLQDNIAEGSNLSIGLSTFMNWAGTEGQEGKYSSRIFPSFNFNTRDNQYSFGLGYQHSLNFPVSEEPFVTEKMLQTRSMNSNLSLNPKGFPNLSLSGGIINNFNEERTVDNEGNFINWGSSYSLNPINLSTNGGWNRSTDRKNTQDGIPYWQDSFNQSLGGSFNFSPTSGVSLGGSLGVGGYQSSRGFAEETGVNRNSNYYFSSNVSTKISRRISASGNFNWSQANREAQTGDVLTVFEPVISMGGGGGLSLEFFKFLKSNLSYNRSWQVNEDIRRDSGGMSLSFLPFDTLDTTLSYGISETTEKSERTSGSNSVTLSAKGQAYKRVDVNSTFQYSRGENYQEDTVTTLWRANPRVSSRLIQDFVVKSLNIGVGYNRQWQEVTTKDSKTGVLIDVVDASLNSEITRVIRVSGSWVWNNKKEGTEVTQNYSLSWFPVKNIQLNFGYGKPPKGESQSYSSSMNLELGKNLTLSGSYSLSLGRASKDEPWEGSSSISGTISIRF